MLVSPLSFSILLFIIGLFAIKKYKSIAFVVILLSIIQLWFFSTSMVAQTLSSNLERIYLPKVVSEYEVADAIVVLGGVVSGPYHPRKYYDISDAGDRLLHALRLYRANKARYIILSGAGGIIPSLGVAISEASIMKEILLDWGIPAESIILEELSHNTYENGLGCKKLIEQHGFEKILLVTSALHMRRAHAVFRSQKIRVIPAPTDYLAVDNSGNWLLSLMPTIEGLSKSTYAIKEYVGYSVYEFRGWINS